MSYQDNTLDFNAVINSTLHEFKKNNVMPNKEIAGQMLRIENRHTSNRDAVLAGARGNYDQVLSKLAASLNTLGASSGTLDANGKTVKTGTLTNFKLRQESEVRDNAFSSFAISQDPMGWGSRRLNSSIPHSSKASVNVLQDRGMSGGYTKPNFRQEAFRDIDQHASTVFSMGYGASITRQTDFIMGWYSPIVLPPDQAFLKVELSLLTVFNGVVHDTDSGDFSQFARRNVVRAFEDPTVLNRESTLLFPIYTTTRAAHFVDAAIFTPRDFTFSERKVHSSYLKFGDDGNLFGLGTTDAVLDTQGKPTHREALEPGTKMYSLLYKSGADILELPVFNLRGMNFLGAQQYDQQESVLNGNILIGLSGTRLKTTAGTPPVGALKYLADNSLRINIRVKVQGSINIETGNYNVSLPTVKLVGVESMLTNEVFQPGDVAYDTVLAAVKAITFEGWLPKPYKTNSTKREQGDRLTSRKFAFYYNAPYRDPVTVERQINTAGEYEAQDLTNLMGLCKIRIENEGIDHMFQMFDLMREYVDMRADDGVLNDLPGLAQFYLKNCFHEESIDLSKFVDSTKNHERAEDIQAFLVMKLRDISTRLLTFMQWKAAMIMQNNDTLPAPQINILTDPIIARYLLAPGDMRTLGDYDYIVTTSLNRNVRNKIALSFRIPGQEASNTPQIFGWGHLFTAPEMVFAANMIRQGDYFSELQVQPRYDFAAMNLSGALLTLTGIPEVLGKVPGYTQLVGPSSTEVKIIP